MHFNTLISTLLSASIAATGVAGSDISERATTSTAANVATLKSIVSDPTTFCTYWQAEYRGHTPFKALTVAQVNSVCNSILPTTTPITTCVKSDLAKLKAVFAQPQYFCNFYNVQSPRLISPFSNIDATALMAVCKYCLPTTSSTVSSSVKASSTAKSSSKSSAKSSSKSSSAKSSSKSSSASSSKKSSTASVKASVTSSVKLSSSSASKSSSVSKSSSSTSATPTIVTQGYLYAFGSNTTADGTALEGFTTGATDVGFGLTNTGYSSLGYYLDNSGYMYLGESGVLLAGDATTTLAEKLGALANGTSGWTNVTCSIDNSTSDLSCSYTNENNRVFNSFQLYEGTSNGDTAYYLQLAPSATAAGVTIRALSTYTATSTATAAATIDASSATITAAATATAVSTTSTATPDFATLTCDTAPTGTFNIYASNSTDDAGAVGKALRGTYDNSAGFYLTDTTDFPVLDFTYDASTGYVVTTDGLYLKALTAALVETSVYLGELSANSYTPLECGIASDCTMLCNYTTAYYENYTTAQIFNVLDLTYTTDNTNDYYTLEMNQYGLPIGVVLSVVPVDDED